MAPPFSMSRLWDHVSIPAEVDGFVIPSPTWLPCFVQVLLHSLSLYSPSLSLFSFFSPPISTVSLEIFLSSSLLSLSRSFREKSLPGINRFSLSHDLSLFFSSFSLSLLLFLTFFLGCASLSLSLSLATEISVARRDFFFSLLSLFRKSFPSFSLSSFSRSPLLPLSHVLKEFEEKER